MVFEVVEVNFYASYGNKVYTFSYVYNNTNGKVFYTVVDGYNTLNDVC